MRRAKEGQKRASVAGVRAGSPSWHRCGFQQTIYMYAACFQNPRSDGITHLNELIYGNTYFLIKSWGGQQRWVPTIKGKTTAL
jgi:hypothetical protein